MPRKSESEEHPMNKIVQVKLSKIDPKSTVNVRRHEENIKESIELVKSSIEKYGYWPEFPIVLRPHPEPQSEFAYENVSGQCRMKASLALGNLEEIPAIIVDLNDDEALQRSLGEGDKRTPLKFSDYTYWVEKKHNEFRAQGCTAGEAYKKTAKFWNISVHKAREYFRYGSLPESVKKKVDEGSLPQKTAKAIVDSSSGFGDQEAEKIMEEKAEAYLNRGKDQRKKFEAVMKDSGNKTNVEEIEVKMEEQANDVEIEITIPSDIKPRVMQWGAKRGLSDLKSIVGNMIVEALTGKN